MKIIFRLNSSAWLDLLITLAIAGAFFYAGCRHMESGPQKETNINVQLKGTPR